MSFEKIYFVISQKFMNTKNKNFLQMFIFTELKKNSYFVLLTEHNESNPTKMSI